MQQKNQKEALPRTMTLFSGCMMVVGMVIGSGIFSIPGILLGMVGSIGMVFIVFVIGALVSLFGVWAYMELGTMLPVSGGDKEYLKIAFPKPKVLISFMFTQSMIWVVRPGFCAALSVSFGEYIMYAIFGPKKLLMAQESNPFVAANYDYLLRGVGVICILFATACHALVPQVGIKVQDNLTIIKLIVLVAVVIIGILSLCGVFHDLPSHNNFSTLFEGTSSSPTSYASALFAAFFTYDGWNNLNYCLDELIDPIVNLPKAAYSALALVSSLYLTATIAFFAVIPKSAIDVKATTLAAQFFTITCGELVGGKIIPVCIALSALGSAMCGTFSSSRVLFTAAREGYVPMANVFAKSNRAGAPTNALLAHCVVTLVFILAPPPGPAYAFLVNASCYPEWIFYGMSVAGLCYMRFTLPNQERPIKSFFFTNLIFIAVCIFLTIFPFVPPPVLPKDGIPYYLYALVGVIWLALLVPWWYVQTVVYNSIENSIAAKEAEESERLNKEMSLEGGFDTPMYAFGVPDMNVVTLEH